MNTLIDNFEIIIDSPNGIEKARQLVLQLAVQGKLTEQWRKENQDVEPASELLKKIKAEKEKLIKEGRIKKKKELEPVTDQEKPFNLTNGWKWERLAHLVSILGDGIHGTPTYDDYGDYYFVNGNNLSNGKIVIKDKTRKVNCSQFEKYKKPLNNRTVLVSINGTLGNVAFYKNEQIILGKSACYFNLFEGIEKEYIKCLIDSPYYLEYANSMATGTTIKNVSLRAMREFPVPVPNTIEQKRIVEKVDSLMSFLDEIEEKRNRREEKRIQLNTSSLDKLVNSKDGKEFKLNWNRITDNFDKLYSVTENVDKLKQTILQLAVQGKLTEQWRKENPKVEPANELLKKIKVEKEKLIKEGKIKKEPARRGGKDLPPIKDEEKPFELPESWEWVRLYSITNIIAGFGFSSHDFSKVNGVRTIKITNVGVQKLVESEDFLPSNFSKEYSDYLVQADDLVIALTRPYIHDGLKICRVTDSYDNALLNQRVGAIKRISKFGLDYLYLYLTSSIVLNKYKARFQNTGLQPNLRMNDLYELEFPLPPMDEQKEIVKRVNELMMICDTLEQQIETKQQKQEKLVEAVVSKLAS